MSRDDRAPRPEQAPWEVLGHEVLQTTPIFSLRRTRCRWRGSAKERYFYALDTVGWINVIALTDDDEVVLVEQFRHGVGRMSLEIPGGMVDPGGETPLEAAQRELKEETGYEAERWTQLGEVDPNPAIQGNLCSIFLAEGARSTSPQDQDEWEDIAVSTAPLADIPRMVREGRITHSLVLSAFHLLGLIRSA